MEENLTATNYVDRAEGVIIELMKKERNKKSKLTTSKIRNLLSMVSVLYTDAIHTTEENLPEDLQGQVQYLRMRMAYESGREESVRDFIEKAKLMEYASKVGESKEKLLRFCQYMEALVAYHRYYGGEDK